MATRCTALLFIALPHATACRSPVSTSEKRGTEDHVLLVAGSGGLPGKLKPKELLKLLCHHEHGIGFEKEAAQSVVEAWVDDKREK